MSLETWPFQMVPEVGSGLPNTGNPVYGYQTHSTGGPMVSFQYEKIHLLWALDFVAELEIHKFVKGCGLRRWVQHMA